MHTSSYEIRVNHLDEAERFYRFILQVKGKRLKGRRFLFKFSDLEIFIAENKATTEGTNDLVIRIAVDQLEYIYARFRALDPGLVIHGLYEVPGQFTSRDPFGNTLTWIQK